MYGIAVEAKDMDLKELLAWSQDTITLMRDGMTLTETNDMSYEECKQEVDRRKLRNECMYDVDI